MERKAQMQQSAGACVGTGRHFPVSICAAGQKNQCPFCPYRYALFVRTLQGLPQCHFYEYQFSRNTPTTVIKFFLCRLSIVLIQFSHARRPSSLSLGQMARPAHEAAPAGVGVGAAALEAPALRRLRQSCARALLQREPLES